MNSTVFNLAHEAAFIGYALFALLLVTRSSRTWLGGLLFVATAVTALWAQASVAAAYDLTPSWVTPLVAVMRDAAWMGLSLGLIYRRAGQTFLWRALLTLAITLASLQIALDVFHIDAGILFGIHVDSALMRVAATILGVVLVENISRNTSATEFWSLKHLLIGLGCLLAFQLFSGVPEFLTHHQDPNMILLRPLVFLLVLPLIVVSSIRLPNLQLRVHSSRAFVFHSTTLVGAGIMLQGVALAAWYVREYGGSNGTVLAVMLLFGGVVAVALTFASGSVRSRIRQFINENFFSLKYDYRVEWEKIIRALSLNPEQGSAERVLRTLCDLLDSPGGALWVHRPSWHQFLPAAKLGFNSDFVPIPEGDPRVSLFQHHDRAFLLLADATDDASEAAWQKTAPREWIVVPLRYRSVIAGLATLAKPRAPKTLDWEDHSFIRLVALQLGAYLVQEETAQSLADARQLEEFNKRFAFIVHDVKNAIGQLSLLVRNVAKFGHQQDFRDDMIETLGNAVDRLQQLLTSLTVVGAENVPGNRSREVFDIIAYLVAFTREKGILGQSVIVKTDYDTLVLELSDVSNFRRVLEHVVTNATDASPEGAPVEISVSVTPTLVEIKVTDQGAGMTTQFINDELFRPMRTTKNGGLGIGAYQARELMRDLGGDILVSSTPGKGSSVTLSLPRIPRQSNRFE